MGLSEAFKAHLVTGATSVCRCWAVERSDGLVFGFTDHDVALNFAGFAFLPDSGMAASSLEQTTGLSVDNTEALGILSSSAVSEDDIRAGRYDRAKVTAWLVNWRDVTQNLILFRGTIGEITRSAGAYKAELRGLTEELNHPQGLVFQKPCMAVLGDAKCRFDLGQAGFSIELPVETVVDAKFFDFANLDAFSDRWFEKGRFLVKTGAASGLVALIKNDRLTNGARSVELWETLPAPVVPGDIIRIEAGCDRRHGTCQLKFDNLLNFRGFPGIPGEDWLLSFPRQGQVNNGGSLSS